MTIKNYSSDSPVTAKEDDCFSRWQFSKSVAQVISKRSDPSSIVVAINGVWGDGKTSVLNFIEQSLSEEVICIKFNPWRFGEEEELLKGFFKNIAEALDTKLITKGEKLKDILKKSASGIGAVAGAKGVGDSISSFLTSPDIEDLKCRIEQELEAAEKRVLIIIDDIDRLEKKEIHALFRLVKLTANFKYTSYILAFDKDVVAASLQEKYSGSSENAGEAFLEKIIQVPLQLPPIEKETLRNFCFRGVDEAISIAQIKLSETQVQEFVRNFTIAFDDSMTTPRKANLYGNILIFSLPILKGEVNPVDLMLIEGIRVFCPNLYTAIRDNKNYFCGVFSQAMGSNDDGEKENIKNIIQLALVKVGNKEAYISLLQNMFPKLNAVYGNMYYTSQSYEEWNIEQRICSIDYFSRYFSYSILSNDIADTEISEIIDSCALMTDNIAKDSNPLVGITTKHNTETLIKKLRSKSKGLSSKQSESLAYAVSSQCNDYPNPISGMWTTTFKQAAILVTDLVQNIALEDRSEIIKQCINRADCINFKFEIYRWMKKENEDKADTNVFNSEQADDIKEYIANQVMEYIQTKVDITKDNREYVYRIFDFVNTYYPQNVIEQYIQDQLEKNTYFIVSLIDSYTGITTDLNSGNVVKSDFNQEQYQSITGHISSDVIIGAIEQHLEEIPLVDSYPHADNDENIQLKQFIWLNNNRPEDKKRLGEEKV